MRSLSRTFKALSESTRLEILALLFRRGELCVCDVEGVLGVSQSKASRHLRYLLAVGLVEDRRDGLWVRYRLVKSPPPEQRRVLDMVRVLVAGERTAQLDARYVQWLSRKAPDGARSAAVRCRSEVRTARAGRHMRPAPSVRGRGT